MTIFKKKNKDKITDIKFNIHKFSDKPKPDPKDVVIISCFSEFGCEVMGSMYCIPRVIKENPNKYYIVMGWYGRSYLYKHLVDEFWETHEDVQFLRDHALAFHNNSKDIAKIEKSVSKYGKVVNSEKLGRIAVGNECQKCFHFWGKVGNVEECPKCKNDKITKGLFSDIPYWRQRVTKIPMPSLDKMEEAQKYLGHRPVAITARNRKTYGRNLQIEFYVKLVKLLEDMGYTPIWIGEKQTTYECPLPHIVDMTRRPESRDLELTFAIVKQCEFTVQFWTASTRLAAVMGVPYLLFESPDQIFGNGQEAYRLNLCTMGKRKLALCHYLNVKNDNNTAIWLVKRCIEEIEQGDFRDVIGMVDEPEYVAGMRNSNVHRLVI